MITIPISFGELLDKLSILQIKTEWIDDKEKKKKAQDELDILTEHYNGDVDLKTILELNVIYEKLLSVNRELWKIEDDIRIKEKYKQFDEHFIELARSVYITNDKRFELKAQINKIMGSNINEVKSYEKY